MTISGLFLPGEKGTQGYSHGFFLWKDIQLLLGLGLVLRSVEKPRDVFGNGWVAVQRFFEVSCSKGKVG